MAVQESSFAVRKSRFDSRLEVNGFISSWQVLTRLQKLVLGNNGLVPSTIPYKLSI